MARAVTTQRKIAYTAAAWAVGLLIFFPVLWTILTSFKTEVSAVASPPEFLGADWTLQNYADVWQRSDYPRFFWNSVLKLVRMVQRTGKKISSPTAQAAAV